MHGNPYRPETKISPKWQAVGGLLFLFAVSAPVALIGMQASDYLGSAGDNIDGANATADAVPVPSERERLLAELPAATIEPGRGLGSLRLGMPYPLATASVDAEGKTSHEHLLTGEGWVVAVTTDAEDQKITAIDLLARSCEDLQTGTPGTDATPATHDSVTLGTHISRIDRRLVGKGDTGWIAPVKQDGLVIDFCPVTGLASHIRIEPFAEGAPVALHTVPDAPGAPSATLHDKDAVAVTASSPDAIYAPGTSEPMARTEFAGAGVGEPMHPSGITPVVTPGAPVHWMADSSSAKGEVPESQKAIRVLPALAWAVTPSELALPGSVKDVKAASTEKALALNKAQRREAQLRLALLGHQTGGIDGIFGERTRAAIRTVQEDWGEAPTGYLTPATLTRLKRDSGPKLAAWKARQRKEVAPIPKEAPVISARLPAPKNRPDCRRSESGEITQNQSFSCDLAILSESLSRLF